MLLRLASLQRLVMVRSNSLTAAYRCVEDTVTTGVGLTHANRKVQEFFAAGCILACGNDALVSKDKTRRDYDSDESSDDDSSTSSAEDTATKQHNSLAELSREALLARGNDSLRRFVAAGLARQQEVDSFVNLLWFERVEQNLSRESAPSKERYLMQAFGADALALLADCIRECRPALLRRVPCVDKHIAPRAIQLWEAFVAPGASVLSFSAGGSRAIAPEFWVVADACLQGERSRQPAIASINAYLSCVTKKDPGATALVCPATLSVEVLRATGDGSPSALGVLGRLRDEAGVASPLRLCAIITLSILGGGGPEGDEVEALLSLACDQSPNSQLVRCGAIVELGLRHAEDAAVRDALLELLLPLQIETSADASPEMDGAPPPFDIVRSVVRALGVPAIPPESLTEVLLHPDAPRQWACAVALQAFEFWLSTQKKATDGANSTIDINADESWTLWHVCAALGQTTVLEELALREIIVPSKSSFESLTSHDMTLLHCALSTRQWELARLLLLPQKSAEEAGYPGLGRLNQRQSAALVTGSGLLPLSIALSLEAPEDLSQSLFDATPIELISVKSVDLNTASDSSLSRRLLTILATAVSSRTSPSIVTRLLALAPPSLVTAASRDETLLELALKRRASAAVILAVIDAARDEWVHRTASSGDLASRQVV